MHDWAGRVAGDLGCVGVVVIRPRQGRKEVRQEAYSADTQCFCTCACWVGLGCVGLHVGIHH
jgi:hypothetical protein